jgi:hypothetical protein
VPDRSRLAVLVSGSGTNLQALLDAIAADPDFGAEVAVVAATSPMPGDWSVHGRRASRRSPSPWPITPIAPPGSRP